MEIPLPKDAEIPDSDWFYGELNNGIFTFMRWDGWRLRIPLATPPGDLSIVRSFCQLPGHDVGSHQLGPLFGFADFEASRAGNLETGDRAPWFAGELQEDGIKFMRFNSWSVVIPWDTTWLDVVRKFAAWSYLTGQLITLNHIGSSVINQWKKTGRYQTIGGYPFLQFSLSPFWCNSMN